MTVQLGQFRLPFPRQEQVITLRFSRIEAQLLRQYLSVALNHIPADELDEFLRDVIKRLS